MFEVYTIIGKKDQEGVISLNYMTPKEAAEKWGISQRRVHTLCRQGRIRDVVRHGWVWLIPGNAEKPEDSRIKSGRYKKNRLGMSALGQSGLAAGESFRPVPLPESPIIPRSRLIEKLCPPGSRLTYIHAPAGHGKTTLLMQYAQGRRNVVWLSLDDRDSDILFFLRRLETSLREGLGELDFSVTDHIPFAENPAFVSTLLSNLLKALGRRKLSLLMDDVHVIRSQTVTKFLTAWAAACPPNISLLLASRHEPWNSLLPLKLAGGIREITEEDLCFSREETEQLWGFFDEDIYAATEGWILAIQSYRLAAKESRLLFPSRLQAEQDLYRYLLNEILRQLPAETQYFLKATSGLPTVEAGLCARLLDIPNARDILEDLVHRNIFTLRLSGTTYRYHALFHSFLQQNDEGLGRETLDRAMAYCYQNHAYEQAADYALLLGDAPGLQDCIGAILSKPFTWSRNRTLKKYLVFLEEQAVPLSPQVMLAKGMILSDQGEFCQAEMALRAAIPHLRKGEQNLYLHAMTHIARVLRNSVSFAESNRCLDSLLPLLQGAPMQEWYNVMIEKIHNLTLTSHLSEALELTQTMMEQSLAAGDARVKAWFERYLTVIHFYTGDYENCVKAYEKSLSIPQEEQDWLMRHITGAYAAKAYQLTGREEKAPPVFQSELAHLQELGLYEEYSIHYLLRAEVLHSAELLKLYQGKPACFSVIDRYLSLAEEYAVLNRSSRDHLLFVKTWRLSSTLMAQPEEADRCIKEALSLIRDTTPFFRSLAYGRIANALDTLGRDTELSKQLFQQSIQVGEEVGSYAYATIAYGRLAAIYLKEGNEEKAKAYTQFFLELSRRYNHRYYIRFQPLFQPVMKLASESGICPDFTREMLSYGCYTTQRVYIHALGNFYIASAWDKETPTKIRTQKARELLAYLLEHPCGVTRERIYADLWAESEADVTRLFHTRRGEIRQAFENLGAKNPILLEKGKYRLNREEILWDCDLFSQASDLFLRLPTPENAQKVVERYTGRYLDNLEALWAESSRLKYEDSFLAATETLLESYRKSGKKTQAMELLRRCISFGYQGHGCDTPGSSIG